MSQIAMDPDLRGALEDVVKRADKSRLFHGMGVNQIGRSFELPDRTWGVASAGLLSAERHILAVHRDALANLLNEAFVANYVLLNHSKEVVVDGDIKTLDQLHREAVTVQEFVDPAAYRYGSLRYLSKLVRNQAIGDKRELASLCIASMRLVNIYKPRVYFALCDYDANHFAQAEEAIRDHLHCCDGVGQAYLLSAYRYLLGEQQQERRWINVGLSAARVAAANGLFQIAGEEFAVSANAMVKLDRSIDAGSLRSLDDIVIERALPRLNQQTVKQLRALRRIPIDGTSHAE